MANGSANARISIGFDLSADPGACDRQMLALYDLFKRYERSQFRNPGDNPDSQFRSIRVRVGDVPNILGELGELGARQIVGLDRTEGRQELGPFLESRGINLS